MGRRDEASKTTASSNWLALQKKLPAATPSKSAHVRKKRKVEHASSTTDISAQRSTTVEVTDFVRGPQEHIASTSTHHPSGPSMRNGESIPQLRKMIAGESEYSESQQQPGKYLALDCEMVGVGIEGKESSLARVSLVNYHGAIQMDEFVRQRERVVDYRTEFSGVRPSDMVNAKPFHEIQQKVADLLNDRILVGHAVHNDLKALLLSHPRHLTRDTQVYSAKHKVTKSRRPALRVLVKQELDVTIQGGEHSSVTDARATMAVYRIHRKEWDKDAPPPGVTSGSKKRKASSVEADDDNTGTNGTAKARSSKKQHGSFPGGGRKGISSGLSTIIKRKDSHGNSSASKKTEKTEWWKELNDSTSGSKGSMRLKVG